MNYFVENCIVTMRRALDSNSETDLEVNSYVLSDLLRCIDTNGKDMVAMSMIRECYNQTRNIRVKQVAKYIGLKLIDDGRHSRHWKWN